MQAVDQNSVLRKYLTYFVNLIITLSRYSYNYVYVLYFERIKYLYDHWIYHIVE